MTKMSHQNGNYPVSAESLSEFSCVYSRSALPHGSFVTFEKSCKTCWKPSFLSYSYFEAEALTLGLCLSYVAAVSLPDCVPHWSPRDFLAWFQTCLIALELSSNLDCWLNLILLMDLLCSSLGTGRLHCSLEVTACLPVTLGSSSLLEELIPAASLDPSILQILFNILSKEEECLLELAAQY